jgi:NitT/TauT family transport system permease protein/taurine transport system permease protein
MSLLSRSLPSSRAAKKGGLRFLHGASGSTSTPARAGVGHYRAVLLSGASLLIAFSIWQLLSTFIFNPFLIPPPFEVIRTAIPMLASGEILADVSISMVRVLVGFVSGSLAGIVLGVLLGRIRLLHDLLDPIIELLRYLSPTAMIPIAVIWFGIGEMSKYFLIFWGTFFIVLINTTAGVWRAPITRQRAAECLGANRLQIFALVVVPSAVPSRQIPASGICCRNPPCCCRPIGSSSRCSPSASSALQWIASSASSSTGC